MNRQRLLTMMEISIMAALSVILGYFKFGAIWAMGGSISLVMVPIFVMMYRRGWKVGVLTGLIVGILHLLTGGFVVHPVQLVLDYPLPYALLGLGGIVLLKRDGSQGLTVSTIISGIVIGASLRFLSHFISGIIWFGMYAPDGMPVPMYSFLYNISYLLPEMILTLVVIVLINKYYPRFFQLDNKMV